MIGLVDLAFLTVEDPLLSAVLSDATRPAEPHQLPPRHVLDRPEIHDHEGQHHDISEDQISHEEVHEQVADHSGELENEVHDADGGLAAVTQELRQVVLLLVTC